MAAVRPITGRVLGVFELFARFTFKGEPLMLVLSLALAISFALQSVGSHDVSFTPVSDQIISLDIPDLTLKEAAVRVFNVARLRYRFDADALAVATTLRRTATFRGVTVTNALYTLLFSHDHGFEILTLRNEGGVFVIGQPTVTLDIDNKAPGIAIRELLSQVGCDYCIDASELGTRHVTISLKDVPLDKAFDQIIRRVAPGVPYRLRYRNGFYLVMTTSSSVYFRTGRDVRPVISSISGHDRKDALEAVFDCMHRGYIIDINGSIQGVVAVRDEPQTADQLYNKLIRGGPDRLTYMDTWGGTIAIYQEDADPGPL
jgi:hypothetical protein